MAEWFKDFACGKVDRGWVWLFWQEHGLEGREREERET